MSQLVLLTHSQRFHFQISNLKLKYEINKTFIMKLKMLKSVIEKGKLPFVWCCFRLLMRMKTEPDWARVWELLNFVQPTLTSNLHGLKTKQMFWKASTDWDSSKGGPGNYTESKTSVSWGIVMGPQGPGCIFKTSYTFFQCFFLN